jgi:site-specific recombinase XerC
MTCDRFLKTAEFLPAHRDQLTRTELAWRRLAAVAEAQVAHHPLQGWRDLAIIRTLGDAGLRCEEHVDLERRDFVAKPKGAKLRALDVRHGKRNRRRKVELKPQAERALPQWDELRQEIGPPPGEEGLPPSRWPLFVTLGRRRRDGSYTRLGQRATHDVAQDLLARLGARAEIPEHLRHPHVLRHTFATRYYRDTHDLAGLQRLLGHADRKPR